MVLTRLAVLLATSLADCTNWRFAVGLAVRAEARRQLLHSAEVCLATMVAAESTWRDRQVNRHEVGRRGVHTPREEPRLGWGMESDTFGSLIRKDRVA